MRISRQLRKDINAGVRRLYGAKAIAEVGVRTCRHTGNWVANGLNWIDDNDLCDTHRLSETGTIDDCPDLPGAATLDLYVYSQVYDPFERRWVIDSLESNVYVVIKDGALADLHDVDLDSDARCVAILGRPFSAS